MHHKKKISSTSCIKDESYLIGKNLAPVAAYLSIDEYIRIAKVNASNFY
jgi:pyruvate carboxylase